MNLNNQETPMKNLLVTGGAGFIGSNFIHYLLKAEQDVRIYTLDALTYAGHRENLDHLPDDSRHTFIHGSINDRARVDDLLRKYRIDTIVHFAAETHVDRSITGPASFIETNVIGTFTLLEAARQAWLDEKTVSNPRFHHVSTDEVFGTLGPDDPPFCETTAYDPNSPYAASKASSDHLVRAYHRTYGLPVTITNCSNNYGPRQYPEKLIPLMIFNALQGKRLPIYGDGQQIRDWLYVEDHCTAIHAVLTAGRLGETYLVGGRNQPPNIELVRRICAILDERFPNSPHAPHAKLMQHVSDRPGHDRRYDVTTGKIEAQLGWQPQHDLDQGLRDTVDWYLQNGGWITAVTGGEGFANWMNENYTQRGAGK
jgi:dTDP-glucose 4,6-dehydratase